jgi:CRISPR-associated endonuclease/helicase Cas3
MPGMRTLGFADFTEFATDAMDGRRPYPYQQRLADYGLPELLRVPNGAGKTAAAVLPWLWRRMRFPDSTQDRLVYVLPLRSLAEQNERQITTWLERLGLARTIPVIMLLGGERRDDDDWRLYPHQPAVLLGTQDVIVSRLLFRGYGEWRSSWPVTFGLLHSCSQFVFDETELFGPALRTSLQLQGLRRKLGSAGDCATMWMSATADRADLVTPDHDEPGRVVELAAADLADERLAKRLAATRVVRRAVLPRDPEIYPAALAGALAAWHVPGTATIAVLNTAERARAVFDALEKMAHAADLLLLHARFRPHERSITAALLGTRLSSAGRIVVATQALEAGVDTSCQTMFTESAPWSSIVARAGRCNRAGDEPGAVLVWAPPPACRSPAEPYDAPRVAAAEEALAALEGTAITAATLADHRVRREHPRHPPPSRADLLQLFDTALVTDGADAAGVDVTPWVHDGGDLTVLVAWRSWPDGRPAGEEPAPHRDELCPAPLADLRQLVQLGAAAYWICDQADGLWRRCEPADFRPGAVLLADAALGGYLPDRGWSPGSRSPVPGVWPVPARRHIMPSRDIYGPGGPEPTAVLCSPRSARHAAAVEDHSAAGPDAIDRDPATFTGCWVDLCTHLEDTECELRALIRNRQCAGFTPDQLEAAALAARFHDLGKAFRHFQDYLRRSAAADPPGDGPWAKSPGRGGRHDVRPFLRHELITALALLQPRCGLLDGVAEPDLVAYLAAAHHGKVRVRAAPMPGEADHDPPRILGVEDGDELPAVRLPGGARTPALTLDTRALGYPAPGTRMPDAGGGAGAGGGGGAGGGAGDDAGSWTARVLALRDRPDLGPFRLAYLEALVRIADWRASRHPSADTRVPAPDEAPVR